uniref:Secreted protein n=1 Tax=Mus spicilegus TaxID=10103 RepID=A0A8C6H1S7_MUSSI
MAPNNGFLLQKVCLLPVTHLASFSTVLALPCHFLFSPCQVFPRPSSIRSPSCILPDVPPVRILFWKL